MTQALATVPKLNIHVPSIPKHLKLSEGLVEDTICDPVIGAEHILKERLDHFQRNRLRISWWVPRVMDSSGFSSAKTKGMWLVGNIRCLVMPGRIGLAAYPVFATGQQSYWKYYAEVAARSPMFRAHIGKRRIVGLDGKTDEDGKATLKGQSCWTCDYKNGSQMMLPAVGFLQDARTMASLRINDLFADEHTKSEAGGSTGIDDQLVQRATLQCFNKNHPLWCNHQLFCATAEDSMHPSYERYSSFVEEIEKGNPEYAIFSYSMKDYSDDELVDGRSFKDVLREDRVLRDMKKNKSRAGYLQEAFGIWSKTGKGLYTKELFDQAYENGRSRGVEVMLSRQDDWVKDPERRRKIFFFLGGDPAKADQKKADDGALVALRAEPVVPSPTSSLDDWALDYVWALKVRKADAPTWSAIMHRKHKLFDFSRLVLDHGGGGQWVRPELAKSRQCIRGAEFKVKPLACIEDEATMVRGEFILSMFRRGDSAIKKLWGDLIMRGEDNLIDAAHTEFLEAWMANRFGLPPRLKDRKNVNTSDWPQEFALAVRLIEVGVQQLRNLAVRTNEDGTTFYTSQTARQFFASKGRKDFAYAMLHAFVAFLQWVQTYEDNEGDKVSDEDAELCS